MYLMHTKVGFFHFATEFTCCNHCFYCEYDCHEKEGQDYGNTADGVKEYEYEEGDQNYF